MGRQTREVSVEDLGPGTKGLDGSSRKVLYTNVYYSLGGTNYFTYKDEPRGYYLSVGIEERSEHMRAFDLFSGGVKKLLEPAARFSAKRLAEIVVDPALAVEMRAYVLAEQAKKVAQDAARRAGAANAQVIAVG